MLWIFAFLSLLLAVFALICRSLWWMIASAAIYAPFALYLGMTPRFRYVPFFLIFFLLRSSPPGPAGNGSAGFS